MGNVEQRQLAMSLLSGLSTTMAWSLFFIAAFLLMAIIGNPMIKWLKSMPGMKWSAREDTPDTHLQKHGTPSMGGVGIISAGIIGYVLVVTVLMAMAAAAGVGLTFTIKEFGAVYALPLYTFLHMLLGWTDDRSKATGRGGMRARDKFIGQCVLAVGFLVFAYYSTIAGTRELSVPMLLLFGFAGLIFLVGTCNAVNITDGIDGLAAGLAVQTGCMFGLVGFASGNMSDNAAMFWAALGGACLGFLLFNRFPAKVFMGDTGSLALGAAVGAAAILTRSVLLLPFIGFIFYVELLSVTTQVLYFKYTRKKTGEGKRLFRRAPLHHHFELGGWSERRVVATFWLVNLVTSTIGLVLWQQGIIPRFP